MERSVSEQEQSQSQGSSRNDLDRNPQPINANPPGFPQNNPTSLSARIKANLPYFKTPLGILKIVNVIFGLIAVGLIGYGYQYAALLQPYRQESGSSSNCHRSNSTFCDLHTYFENQLCENKARDVTVCVNPILVSASTGIIVLTVFCSVFALFVKLLQQQQHQHHTKTRISLRRVMRGYLVVLFLAVVSGFFAIAYFVQVRQEDLCGNSNLKAEATDYVMYEHEHKLNSSGGSEKRKYSEDKSKKFEMVLANLTGECPEKQKEKYYHWHFFIGGIFAVIMGVGHLVSAALSRKESSQAVDPVMMVMGPNGPQPQPSPQAQMQSATDL